MLPQLRRMFEGSEVKYWTEACPRSVEPDGDPNCQGLISCLSSHLGALPPKPASLLSSTDFSDWNKRDQRGRKLLVKAGGGRDPAPLGSQGWVEEDRMI